MRCCIRPLEKAKSVSDTSELFVRAERLLRAGKKRSDQSEHRSPRSGSLRSPPPGGQETRQGLQQFPLHARSVSGWPPPPRQQLPRQFTEASRLNVVGDRIAIRAGPHEETAVRRQGFTGQMEALGAPRGRSSICSRRPSASQTSVTGRPWSSLQIGRHKYRYARTKLQQAGSGGEIAPGLFLRYVPTCRDHTR